MKPVHVLLLILLATFASSCSSAIKRKCESTNWFEYGASVAKQGQRIASDSFVLACEKEKAAISHSELSQGFRKGMDEYCTPDFAYRLGKQGEFFVPDMCAPHMEKQLKAQQEAGVLEYCQANHGVLAGASGKKYNHICPKELEPDFLPEFNKGRKKYLTGLMTMKESEIQDLEREIGDLDRKLSRLRHDIQQLDRRRMPVHRPNVYDPKTAANEDQLNVQHNREIDNRIQSLRWDYNNTESTLNSKKERQQLLRKEVRETQGELITL